MLQVLLNYEQQSLKFFQYMPRLSILVIGNDVSENALRLTKLFTIL